MELSLGSWSRVALSPSLLKPSLFFHRCNNLTLTWNHLPNLKPYLLRFAAATSPNHSSLPNGCGETHLGDFWRDSQFVEVIAIGSRKDAVLNFCLDSPFQSPSLRYWSFLVKDSTNVQLQQRVLGKDLDSINLEVPPSLTSSSKIIILVASTGYGVDDMPAVDILKTIRSANGFTVAIVLEPFNFEGQRRLDEVRSLMEKIKEHTNLLIDLDTNKLLKKDLVTLDEAVKTANNAVLLAITSVSVLKADMLTKLIGSSCNDLQEIKVPEIFSILERYKEAKIGFGAGYNIKTSILQSMYDCPFLGVGVKDLDGVIICILASSSIISKNDTDAFVHSFRQTTEYTKEILISTIYEPSLEPNLIVTTVLVIGFTERQDSQKSSILTRLAQRFPFIFRLLRRNQSSDTQGNSLPEGSFTSDEIDSPEVMGNVNVTDVFAEGSDSESEQIENGFSEDSMDSFSFHDPPLTEDIPAFQREELVGWNMGAGHHIAQEWAKERAAEAGATSTLDKLSIFCLPVGVRPEVLKDRFDISKQYPMPTGKDILKSKPSANSSTTPWNELTDTGLEAMKDIYNTASTLLKGNSSDPPKKQRLLSVRAASMLEAERDSPKKWNPTVKMKYRGGIYRGRCQGGLPEGKGRLVLEDGSIYDGMWQYGKRSGSGTFYFSNGDVFQGSWRDDVMHGKGWFYFYSGDRWFANFWKGKANGEGRFYSKSGEVLFGHFQNGWRHGEFICIDVDGSRCIEKWDEGILMSRSPLESQI
ncbi:protein ACCUMULATION AND REPLICATION OF CHLOROPLASTS 3, chloroplastic [Humulus lupulus]|uniref:protein ACCUMULATION AND REPLICATION OF CHLOROPLASTS 3, chloroplastic n=1 Tax=Humulus lupulus TaxID=3486 RepID=UPI002B4105DC|nr:protein ACCUMULATION AND REPLICATION OF CHLOROPLASTS 3, chloroplastic [Humulus lupulus]